MGERMTQKVSRVADGVTKREPGRLSFDVADCREHLNKLGREIERLEKADNRVDKSDHAINAALTAWHLHEWVWHAVKKIERSNAPDVSGLDPDMQQQLKLQNAQKKQKLATLRVEIGKGLGIKPAGVDKDEFGRYMADKHRSIARCRAIATGSKHLNAGDPEIETYVSATDSTSPVSISIPGKITMVFHGVPKVVDGDVVLGTTEVFREAQQAWTDLIYRYGIDDD